MSTARPRPQVMKLTERAASRIKAILADKGAGTAGLRIGIKKGGCAGMEYTMEWAAEQKPFDEVVEQNGAKVLIDPKAVMYLLGTEMDRPAPAAAANPSTSPPWPKTSSRACRLKRLCSDA
jgi:iron-sulfur cluster assembly protein